MSQLAINLGILLAQTCGLFFSDYGDWRYIFAVGAGLAALNAILVLLRPNPPNGWPRLAIYARAAAAWNTSAIQTRLTMNLSPISSRSVALKKKLYYSQRGTDERTANRPRGRPGSPSRGTSPSPFGSLAPLGLSAGNSVSVIGLMAFQQICGVNSIVFYSVEVLAGLLPRLAPVLNCIISAITCVIVIASCSIVDKHGRKVLLLTSMAGMAATAHR